MIEAFEQGFRAGFAKVLEDMRAECRDQAASYQEMYMHCLDSASNGNIHMLDAAAFFYRQKMMHEYEIPKVIAAAEAMMGDLELAERTIEEMRRKHEWKTE